jgi:hypothetical protein
MLLAGSLVTMARTCGKPRCRCREGQKHLSLYLSIRVGKGRKMVYVPARLEQTVRAWVDAYQRARRLTDSISQDCLQRLLKAKEDPKHCLGTKGQEAQGTSRP